MKSTPIWSAWIASSTRLRMTWAGSRSCPSAPAVTSPKVSTPSSSCCPIENMSHKLLLRRQAVNVSGDRFVGDAFGRICGHEAQSDQLLPQFFGHGLQAWKEMALQRFQLSALAMNADVQRGNHPAVKFLQRDRDRAKSDLDLLVGNGVAGFADGENCFAQFGLVGDGEFGDFLRPLTRQKF